MVGQSNVRTGAFCLDQREYLTLFITRGRGWARFLRGYAVRVLIAAALFAYFTESWGNGGRALLLLGSVVSGALLAVLLGSWWWIARAARCGECVRFEPVYYTLDADALTLHTAQACADEPAQACADDCVCCWPLFRVRCVVRTGRYWLLHVDRGLFHCVPLAAFASEQDIQCCERWFMAEDVRVYQHPW